MLQYIVLIGAAVQLAGIFVYIKQTLRGETKPNRVSWLMWSIAPTIAAVAAISDGVRWAVLPVFMTGFAPFLVFIASFINPKSYWKLERLDYICGVCSILALVFWAITKQPLIAILLAIASDIGASIPTIIKSWRYPETESGSAYAGSLFSAATSFFALKLFNVAELAFPIYLIFLNLIIVVSVYKNKWKRK